MSLTAMPFSPSPLFLLPSHLLQQLVAMVVQLLVPLWRCDPRSPGAQHQTRSQNLWGGLTRTGSAMGRGLPAASARSLPARS